MRIAMVTETYPPEINGVALTVHSLVEQLVQAGHTVDLIRPRQATSLAGPGSADAARIDEDLVRGASLPRYPGLRFGWPSGTRLRRRWTAKRPDAVYIATEGPLGSSALTVSNALGIPSATGFHTRFDDFVAHYGLGFLSPIALGWMRRFHNRGHATLVPTAQLRDQLRACGFQRVELLGRAVDTSAFHPRHRDPALRARWGLSEPDLAIIHVGRLAPEKNLDLAVRAFDRIKAECPTARFVWVGDGPVRAHWQQRRPEFVFCGMQRGHDLARHFASGDLFLFPSLTETFGNVTLESLASGVPVLAYDYGAAGEHMRDGVHGRTVPRDDEDGFLAAAEQLATLAADPRQRMRGAARSSVLQLSPAVVAADFAALLQNIATQRSAA